ncbi:MAG: GNAT family N-acetyltransferase [Pseudomonadota bacterium]
MTPPPAGGFAVDHADLNDPALRAMAATHARLALAQAPPGSCHAFDFERLVAGDVQLFWAKAGDALLGIGALQTHAGPLGELKAMYSAPEARGRGVGGAILATVIDAARTAGLPRISLETGSQPYFAASRRLYARAGFVVCPPFGRYVDDPNSVYMTLSLG